MSDETVLGGRRVGDLADRSNEAVVEAAELGRRAQAVLQGLEKQSEYNNIG